MNLSNSVLLIIDVQNDFCPGGALAVPHGDEVVVTINSLSKNANSTILTQDWHPAGHMSFASSHPGKAPFDTVSAHYGEQVLWPDHCVSGSSGADFHDQLDTTQAELVLRKGFRAAVDSYSAFNENDQKTSTGLAGYLHSRDFKHVYVAGLATDYCVAWSALDARKLNFEVTLITDACRAIDLDGSLSNAMTSMQDAGVNFKTSTEFLNK